jgi:hypothetical protein
MMVHIPAGRVMLSDRRTQRRWSVALEPYHLSAVAVTQGEYASVTGQRPSASRGDDLAGADNVVRPGQNQFDHHNETLPGASSSTGSHR